MHISLVGVNHQTAPITVREKVAISREKLYDSLLLLHTYIPQGIILSTCSRTEVYTTDIDRYHAREASLNFLKAHINTPEADLLQCLYVSNDCDAVEHLFRVACGLDSIIVGEFEVLGQIGYALGVAEKVGMVNLPLRYIFNSAIRTSRRAREETGISKNALSVSSVAVNLAAEIAGDFKGCKMLVIGAGEAGRLVAKVAKDRGISQIIIASRNKERASDLAVGLGGKLVSLSNLMEELSTANIVVTCSAAPHRILSVRQVEEAMRKRPQVPAVIIDIAVPRNVEPAVRQIKNVFLYDIDALTKVSNLNRIQRAGEIQKAVEIITAEVDKFVSQWQAFEVRPVVSALMSKAEDIRSTQLNKTLKRLHPLSGEEQESLEAMTRSIVTKILKDPIRCLKTNGNSNYTEMVRELFRLNAGKHS